MVRKIYCDACGQEAESVAGVTLDAQQPSEVCPPCFDRLFGILNKQGWKPTVAKPRRDAYLTQRIMPLLESQPGKFLRVPDIAKALGGNVKMSSLATTLGKLTKDNRIERRGRGVYGSLGALRPANASDPANSDAPEAK
jgi:hypothetical protein